MPCCAELIGLTIGPNQAWHGGLEARPKHGRSAGLDVAVVLSILVSITI
jgi:hypothetical protein